MGIVWKESGLKYLTQLKMCRGPLRPSEPKCWLRVCTYFDSVVVLEHARNLPYIFLVLKHRNEMIWF